MSERIPGVSGVSPFRPPFKCPVYWNWPKRRTFVIPLPWPACRIGHLQYFHHRRRKVKRRSKVWSTVTNILGGILGSLTILYLLVRESFHGTPSSGLWGL